MDILIQILMAFAGSLGFALMLNVKKGHIFFASLNGLISWTVYLIGEYVLGDILAATTIASVVASVYAEIMARRRMAPATQFMIIGLIPMIPGASLYYAMYYAFLSDGNKAKSYGMETLKYAFGIVIGISFVWAVIHMINKIKGEIANASLH